MQGRSSQLKMQLMQLCKKKAWNIQACSPSFPGYITNQFNDQLPVGLLAQ